MSEVFSVFSANPGIGLHLLPYQKNGGRIRYALERLATPATSLTENLQISNEVFDSRYFWNKKSGGDELLGKLGMRKGDLDILDFTTHVASPNDKEPQNLYDCLALVKLVLPKVFVGFTPLEVLHGKNPINDATQELTHVLDSVRHRAEKGYLVVASSIDTADFGSLVSRRLGLVVGVREDFAQSRGVSSESELRMMLPRPQERKAIGSILSGNEVSVQEKQFLIREVMGSDLRLMRLIRDLGTDPTAPQFFQTTERRWSDYGYKKTDRPKVVRCSSDHPIFLSGDTLSLCPNEDRPFSQSELTLALGLPKEWKLVGRDADVRRQLQVTLPKEVTEQLLQDLMLPLLSNTITLPEATDVLRKQSIQRLEGKPTNSMRTFYCDVDVGFDHSKSFKGKTPTEEDFDYLFDANEINEDFIVYGAYNPVEGRREVVGAIRRGVFKDSERETCVDTIARIKTKTDKRTTECPRTITKSLIDGWEEKGIPYKISKCSKKYKLCRNEKWDAVWRSVAIPSTTVGWSRDKITGLPQKSSVLKDASLDAGFRFLNSRATSAYRQLAFDDFVKQARYVRKRIPRKHTISPVFTTMAVNRYGKEMPAMNYHIDHGDSDSGLTTISVFDEGCYEGGLFVMPRYRCAFRIGDGDVFVANSRQMHGVTSIKGKGRRLSVVSYTKTNVGATENLARAYPPKSPRPKFRVSDYQVAIPSYKRDTTLRDKTLRLLERYKVDPARVTIFVADESELEVYRKTLADSPYKNFVVAEKGMKEVRNFMWNYYPEGTPVMFMDDDLLSVKRLQKERGGEKLSLVPVEDLYGDVIRQGFDVCREYRSYLWGIYAANNAMFMSAKGNEISSGNSKEEIQSPDQVVVGNQYIIGSFWGAVIRHNPSRARTFMVGTADKEDHERSVQHFIEDGRTVKLRYITVDTNYYGEQGGMQEERTLNTVSEGALYMKANYPKYVRVERRERKINGRMGMYHEVRHI